jgi:short-subunit dehydrogenase
MADDDLYKDNWLVGKTVLVTGATSGVGKALAMLLARNGSTVIAHGRSESRLASLVEATQTGNIATIVGDLNEERGWKAVESAILEKQPNALVINAGYNAGKKYASGWTDSEVFEMLQVNLISPILCIRTFASLPTLSEPRRLALILSTSCHFPRPMMSLYISCKMGLQGFGKALQQESLDLSLRTILFYPGRFNSRFRKTSNNAYMKPESVAQTLASVLCLPSDVVPYEFTFRPAVDTYI